ncbi:MAG: hypothetical protein ACRDZU_02930 [Acidimicrobiales bacterium]
MRKSWIKLYAPFIALAALQAVIIVAAPSKAPDGGAVTALGPLDANGQPAPLDGAIDPATGAPVDGSVVTDPGAIVTTGGGGTGGTTGGATGGTDGGGVTAQSGDTSHCKDGRQTNVIFNAPPCRPKFTGSNGGATYRGVTDSQILVVDFQCQPNEQVNAILATQGLAASEAETKAMEDAAVRYINERYELYGRKIVVKRVVGDCPLTPPDPAKSRQAATEVVKMNPFMVIHYAAGPETHDVWSRNGIISLGGPNMDISFYNGRRPYRWDVFPSGTEGADEVAEYYCKKMATGKATNAGAVIHASIGGRTTPRKLGVIIPDNGNGASTPNAARVKAIVEKCSGKDVPVFTYQSDINRAAEQTRVTVAGLINAKVTTVVCMCDAIAPVFLTNGMTQNSYFPEHLLPAANLLDYDVLGRLYDPLQWTHAFGPSQLVKPIPHEQSDAALIWRAAGNKGLPCASCNLITGYWTMIGTMLQEAGPTLNPLTVERGVVGTQYRRGGWAETKGNPSVYLVKFGPNDYSAISDFREVYWDANARSGVDGKSGAYVDINGGRRYEPGQNQLPTQFTIPAKSQ